MRFLESPWIKSSDHYIITAMKHLQKEESLFKCASVGHLKMYMPTMRLCILYCKSCRALLKNIEKAFMWPRTIAIWSFGCTFSSIGNFKPEVNSQYWTVNRFKIFDKMAQSFNIKMRFRISQGKYFRCGLNSKIRYFEKI